MAKMILQVMYLAYMLVIMVHQGNGACTEPTVDNGCVDCNDANSDGEISTGETCTVTCSDAQTATVASATCQAGGSFSAVLACPTAGATTDCTVPTVANGCVQCMDTASGGDGDAPDDTESCTVTCDDGYGTDTASTTCETNALSVTLACTACSITNCVICASDPDACTACADGYGVDGAMCSECSVSNCATCPAAVGTCTGCDAGYRLQDSSTCEACTVANCATCDADAATCTACTDGYGLDSAVCAECDDANCATCAADHDVCTGCDAGYRVESDACQECSVDNCATCTAAAGTCTACMDGYRLEDGMCEACDEGCATCTTDDTEEDDEVCQTCNDGYSLSDGACTQDSDENAAPIHFGSQYLITSFAAVLMLRYTVM